MRRKIIALEGIAFSPDCLLMRVGAWQTYLKKCSRAALRLAPLVHFFSLDFLDDSSQVQSNKRHLPS